MTKHKMVLGIDPGQKNTGLAIVSLSSRGHRLVEASTIVNESVVGAALEMAEFVRGVGDQKVDIKEAAMLVFEMSPRRGPGNRPIYFKSSMMTQRTMGALAVMVHQLGIDLWTYDEEDMRLAIGGHRNVKKAVIKTNVGLQVKGCEKLSVHEYDACAVCLLHSASRRIQSLIDS